MPSIGGPSAASMMPTFSPGQGTNFDKGREIAGAEMALKQRYTAPTQFAPNDAAISGEGRPVGQYNEQQAPAPVKYYVPGPEDQYMQNRQAIREAAGQGGVAVTRVDPITDQEVMMLQKKKDQAEVADFDMYVNSLINPRKPGELQWLMSVYPEFVQRRIEQVHQDYEFAVRNQMIDMWGINTKDDLMFKYLVDQKKVDGPRLGRHTKIDDNYAPGLLSPFRWKFNGDSNTSRLFAPFSSAQDGAKPADGNGWQFENSATRPLGSGRGTRAMANSLYSNPQPEVRPNPVGGYQRAG
jgi:hypothetical protein